MRRGLAAASLGLGLAAHAGAQAQPVVRATLSPAAVTVGEPVTLNVDVFVPSYFLGAPRFPQLEVKDAVVVFQQQGGANLNETIAGTSYAGQRRIYLIYPERAGAFDVPGFDVKVIYAVDGKPSPLTPVHARGGRFEASIPAAAKGLPYFLATPSFQIAQAFDRPVQGLKVGDSLTRTITMTAVDAFAMMLPPLSFPGLDGLATYAAQPQVSDSSVERGATRLAKRVESATFMFQKPGHYELPRIEIPWWDTSARTLRRSAVPELQLEVAPNPGLKTEIPPPPDPADEPRAPDPWQLWKRALRRYGPSAFGVTLLLAAAWRLSEARVSAWRRRRAARRREREESAAAYLERVRRTARTGRPEEVLAATYRWLDRRQAERAGAHDSAARLDRFARESGDPALPGLADALVEAVLTPGSDRNDDLARHFLQALLGAVRRPTRAAMPSRGLEPLNPGRGRGSRARPAILEGTWT